MSHYGSSELAVLLSHLSPTTDLDARASGAVARPASPSEAMALYFVAARLVELQLELGARGRGLDLSAELATTREVLEGTRRALLSALAAAEGDDSDDLVEVVPGPPTLSVVDGGRAGRKRARREQ